MIDKLLQPLPEAFAVFAGALFTVVILLLALTRLRGTRLAPLAGANMLIFLLWMIVLGLSEPSPWRLQVIITRLMELPLVSGLAILCITQARRLTPSARRLRAVLQAAPALLVCAWIAAFVGEQAWPRPTLDVFAEMAVKNWALLTALGIPFLSYLWLLTFLFARATGRHTPTRRLKLQNLFLAVAMGGYALSSVNVVVGYAVQAFLEDPSLREVTVTQILIDERLFYVWGPAFLLGFLFAASPAASRIARAADVLAVVPLRERFEGLAWRLEATGALRRLTRPLYHLDAAASILDFPQTERAKALQAVKLTAVMSSPKAPKGVSREKAAELLSLLEEIDASSPNRHHVFSAEGLMAQHESSNVDLLTDVLDAALELSDPQTSARCAGKPNWFKLARVACLEAGVIVEHRTGYPCCQRTLRAYREAADHTRGAS